MNLNFFNRQTKGGEASLHPSSVMVVGSAQFIGGSCRREIPKETLKTVVICLSEGRYGEHGSSLEYFRRQDGLKADEDLIMLRFVFLLLILQFGRRVRCQGKQMRI